MKKGRGLRGEVLAAGDLGAMPGPAEHPAAGLASHVIVSNGDIGVAADFYDALGGWAAQHAFLSVRSRAAHGCR